MPHHFLLPSSFAETLYLIMTDVLGLASGIISLASLGTKISRRLRLLSKRPILSETLPPLAAEVEMIVHILHDLPDLLQNHRGVLSSNGFESISVFLTQCADIFILLDESSPLVRRADKQTLLDSFGSRNQIGPMLEKLEHSRSTLSSFVKSVVQVRSI